MSRDRSALRNRVEYAAYLGARATAGMLGPRALARLGGLLGEVFWRVGRRRREILDFNLALAFPELDEAARRARSRAVARHFGRVALDALRVQRLSPEALRAEVEVEGEEHLERAAAGGRGLFVLSAHLGSWEVAGLVAGLLLPHGLAAVNRPLDNPLLDVELQRLRLGLGNRVLGKRSIARDVLRELAAGGAVGILIDQRVSEEVGVPAPFFGHPTPTHPILARLVRRSAAPVVPVFAVWLAPGRYRVLFEPALELESVPDDERDDLALTARYTAVVESVIRRWPEQWLWYHDRWRALRRADG